VTDLAALASMTKQSRGEFVDWLEAGGFVTSRKDDHDGRVRLIVRTPQGDAAAAAANRAIAAPRTRSRALTGAIAYCGR
jgi:DNA-binding MarR family transcriptional regulator